MRPSPTPPSSPRTTPPPEDLAGPPPPRRRLPRLPPRLASPSLAALCPCNAGEAIGLRLPSSSSPPSPCTLANQAPNVLTAPAHASDHRFVRALTALTASSPRPARLHTCPRPRCPAVVRPRLPPHSALASAPRPSPRDASSPLPALASGRRAAVLVAAAGRTVAIALCPFGRVRPRFSQRPLRMAGPMPKGPHRPLFL
nr:proline-rich receptor-like protein kinase PERK9 [Aegilops tauschii subsp. strangulata]